MIPGIDLQGDEKLPTSAVSQLSELGINAPIEIVDVPVQATNQLTEKVFYYRGTKLYIKLSGVLYELTLSQTA